MLFWIGAGRFIYTLMYLSMGRHIDWLGLLQCKYSSIALHPLFILNVVAVLDLGSVASTDVELQWLQKDIDAVADEVQILKVTHFGVICCATSQPCLNDAMLVAVGNDGD
ncbi:unnamed protein product [Peronospora belbahrii]|uniref:Uncharacterized protein n=1 Tax=Peronospora belbahrii TaxID=622444 RepID=A0AAU9KLD0_9STRA|nr:unnamed protein product [Peronospora belbahrii]CAH0515151.1 unnamed protein product [Peronospora belbahrii]